MGVNPKLAVGDDAPDFEAIDQDGAPIALSDFAGRRLVLYFYPKDDTPGCTTQACDFRDHLTEFSHLEVDVVGVSPDGPGSHVKFRAKYELPFPLVSDPDHAVAEAYGVWREKKNYGKTYMGIVRSTFIISPQGKLEAVMDNVRAKGHVAKVLGSLDK